MTASKTLFASIATLLSLCLAGCGGGLDVTVGGSLTGLNTGTTLVLQNNGSDTLTLTSNGSFSFPKSLDSNIAYNVTVLTQPSGQSCSVSNGAGTIASPAVTVTNVTITCTTSTLLVGSISGLRAGTSVVLQNNGAAPLTIATNGAFSFPGVTTGAYVITVSTPPALGNCSVTSGGSGTIGTVATAIVVTCT